MTSTAAPTVIERSTATLAILGMVENQMTAVGKLPSVNIDSDAVHTILRIVDNQTTTINTIPSPIDEAAVVAILRILENQIITIKDILSSLNSETALIILRIFENQKEVLDKIPSSVGDATLSILRILENQMEVVDQVAPLLFGENSTHAVKRKPSSDQERDATRTTKRARAGVMTLATQIPNDRRPHSAKKQIPSTSSKVSVDKLATRQIPPVVNSHQKQATSVTVRYNTDGKPVNKYGQRVCEICHTTGRIHQQKPGVVTEKWAPASDGRPGMLCEKCRRQELKREGRSCKPASPARPAPVKLATTTPVVNGKATNNVVLYNASGKPINDKGQRICENCRAPGRMHQSKPGVETEKWGRGVDGRPGMLCQTCTRQVTSQANQVTSQANSQLSNSTSGTRSTSTPSPTNITTPVSTPRKDSPSSKEVNKTGDSNNGGIRYNSNGKPVNEQGQRICEMCHTTGRIHHQKPGVVTEKWARAKDGRPGMLCERCSHQPTSPSKTNTPLSTPSPVKA